MTRDEAMQIAHTLKRAKPNDETATVGERLLWARLAKKFQGFVFNYVTGSSRLTVEDWRAAADLPPNPEE